MIGFSAASDLHGRVGTDVLVLREDDLALAAALTVTRNDLVGEEARGLRTGRALVRADSEGRPVRSREIEKSRRRFSAVSSMPPGTG